MNAIVRLTTRHSRWVLFGFIALIALSTIWGFQAFGKLKSGGYDNPGAQSGVVARILTKDFKQAIPDAVLYVDFQKSADATSSVALADVLTSQLQAETGVNRVTSYYSLGTPASLRSIDGNEVYFFVYYKPGADPGDTANTLQGKFDGWFHGARVYVGGGTTIGAEINGHITKDMSSAESVAVPVTILLLIFVFGSVVAAGLPFLVAVISAIGSLFALWVAAQIADTSVFGVNLITGLSLGLGIDYALLMVNRYREERLSRGVTDAVEATIRTAGRTVFFSGLTVAVVLLALGFFPQYFLRSFAVAGVSIVLFAVLGALFALPALLHLLGDRVDKWKIMPGSLTPKDKGIWERISRGVMLRPLRVLFVVLIALAGLVSLGHGVNFGLVDDRILPADSKVVVASDQGRTRFAGREGTPVEVILGNPSQDELIQYTNKLSQISGVVRVQSPLGITQSGILDTGYSPAFANYAVSGLTRVQAITDIDPRSSAGVKMIGQVRGLVTNIHYVRIGGAAANYTDALEGIGSNLPKALLWLSLATLVLLFLFTGSVILPIKAVLLNLLSLAATMGFLTWVFQFHNLTWLIGDFQTTGSIDSSTMVLVAVITFGLSMDYELFLLSRIKEQHDAGQSTIDAVSFGLQRSGRIITTAALVLAVSFLVLVVSSVSIIKLLGLGVAFAILLDATVVRALLVPALMRLFGEYNWWAPRWLKALYQRAGLEH
jgi:putative drug exporter of the RND superfamily